MSESKPNPAQAALDLLHDYLKENNQNFEVLGQWLNVALLDSGSPYSAAGAGVAFRAEMRDALERAGFGTT